MKTFDCEQYSAEWWACRRGIPTASGFSSIITPKKMQLAAAHTEYICKLIADQFDPLYGQREEFVSKAMAQGLEYEQESRDWYALEAGEDVQRVGFCLDDAGRF